MTHGADMSALATTTLGDAKEQLAGDDATLDQMADDLLKRMAQFIGECTQEESFCGVAINCKRDPKGKLLYMQFVPVDEIGGTPARRWSE